MQVRASPVPSGKRKISFFTCSPYDGFCVSARVTAKVTGLGPRRPRPPAPPRGRLRVRRGAGTSGGLPRTLGAGRHSTVRRARHSGAARWVGSPRTAAVTRALGRPGSRDCARGGAAGSRMQKGAPPKPTVPAGWRQRVVQRCWSLSAQAIATTSLQETDLLSPFLFLSRYQPARLA